MSESCITLDEVSYSYGDKEALKSVSFGIEKGTFCALLGPNGAGKSTLFALLTRLFVTRRGKIKVAGHDLAHEPREALSKIGVVFQQSTIDLDLSVRRNLSYFCALHGISGKDADLRIDKALERLDMAERSSEKARALNGGHRRRMEIARALLHEPAVLLLDEPTVGLDASARKSITDYVHDLTTTGVGVLWATHLVDEVRDDDQLVILHRGEILKQGRTAEVRGDQTLAECFTTLTGVEA